MSPKIAALLAFGTGLAAGRVTVGASTVSERIRFLDAQTVRLQGALVAYVASTGRHTVTSLDTAADPRAAWWGGPVVVSTQDGTEVFIASRTQRQGVREHVVHIQNARAVAIGGQAVPPPVALVFRGDYSLTVDDGPASVMPVIRLLGFEASAGPNEVWRLEST